MKVNCKEHSKSMELLGLKMRLKEGISDSKEKEEIEKRIGILEKELDMN
ncbi:hypothetical protein ACFL2O_02200 [Thermodesulfobacteriota bacterium]